MKALVSVNYKFMNMKPNDLVSNILKNSKYAKGIEINIDYQNNFELAYLKELVIACKNNDCLLQIHGDSNLDLNMQLDYMKMLEEISDTLGYKIHVVLHPIYSSNKEESINNTIIYMNELIDKVDNDKIIISLENLNDLYKKDRLDKQDIKNIILNNERLFMTYDIGNGLVDNDRLIDLDEYLLSEISNLHIHTYDNHYDAGYDHKVILKNDEHWNQILKVLTFLKLKKYDGNIVFEYSIDDCEGNTLEEKLKYYLNSIDYVCERL